MRKTDHPKLDSQFIERWSPRAFSSEPIAEEDLQTLFEAARWSPSCFNEQPWRFVYAQNHDDLGRFRSVLAEANQTWANSAPLLVLIFSKKRFTQNGKPNRWADFDTGAAWMALALQAHQLGLITHAMGGFDVDKAFEVTTMDADEYDAVCAVAVGKPGNVDDLPDTLKEREVLSGRKALEEIVFEGTVKFCK